MRGIRDAICLSFLVLSGFVLAPECHSATYYKYVDNSGTICFSDSRQAIPEQYRKTATKITDEKENENNSSREVRVNGRYEEGSPADEKKELSVNEKIKNAAATAISSGFAGSAAVIIIFLALFKIAGKIGRSLNRKHLSSVLRIALTAGLLLYLFHSNG